MAPPAEDRYCRQFLPNTFDPSRCRACLRPDHMHLCADTSAAAAATGAQEDGAQEEDADDVPRALSEVTSRASSDDVSGVWTYEWSLVHSLSPEWELNICDTEIQSNSPHQWDSPERSKSLSPERNCEDHRDMTRLDPAKAESSCMDERRGRDRSRRESESRGNREQESGYFSPDRRGVGERPMEEVTKRPYRYYERGHALPNNYVPEPKACVPYRNVNLGTPSLRRNPETYLQEIWRSESPERYTYHSNFRRGADSQNNSPTRHSSVSPDRYKLAESPVGSQRKSSLSRSQARSHSTSHGSSPLPSHGLSRRTSSRSSPSRRRGSTTSRAASPSRVTPSHRSSDSLHLKNGDYDAQRRCSRDLRSPSQASNKHSLDSEKLYRNLESISRRGSSAIQHNSYEGSQSSPRTRTAFNSSANSRTRSSREVSPSRNGYSTHSHTPQREPPSRDSRLCPSQGSWQGSAHSLLSIPGSRGSSTSRRGTDSQLLGASLSHVAIAESDISHVRNDNQVSGDRSRSNIRRGMEALLISEPKKAAVEEEEVGMTIDDYIVLADIPTIQLELEEELTGLRRRDQSPSPCRDHRPRTHRSQDEMDTYSSTLEQSVPSTHSQSPDYQGGKHRSSKVEERASAECPQMQGWMSSLDDHGKWGKHWFVLGDSTLRYYRDPEAEESNDLDGEINLTSSVNVSDCDVEKNYGLQIQTKRAVFTLSVMTSRIRRNWIKLLKQAIQNNAHQSDNGRKKENPLSWRPSSCQPSAQFTCRDSGYEATTSTSNARAANSHKAEHLLETIEGDLDVSPSSQREEGEGWDREQAKRLEERNKWFEEGVPFSEMSSRWDAMELKRGSVPVPVIETLDSEVNRKWVELEALSFRDAQALIGAQAHQSSTAQATLTVVTSQTHQSSPEEAEQSATSSQTDILSSKEALPSINGAQEIQTDKAEALQKEALSLREQVESIKRERAAMRIEVDSPCGPGAPCRAPCRARLEAMEAAHQKTLQELQEKHAREIKELEEQRDRMLQEESQAAARAMESLRAAHREDLEREVEKARRLAGGAAHMDASHRCHMPQADVLHGELDVLSERYSQKCLELSRTEQNGQGREIELGRKEREMEQLRRENQELKRTASEVETLLRAKENEVQYLKKEIICLQNEVQSLTKEKEASYERYKEAYVELSDMRGRSQLETGSLNEHLRLANAALQEGARQT
ncbi:TRIO and F-actin-binding protein [Dissostichus eleginoides]|uniref:TRIO and F-actin-binding protein n=1 Tax=Dissostichus eleginoides TaxID=100907 RepID=A0AAD9F3H5_DISEL|nr:TRIO and F-actin-binding protein [Dissostichus eleginoides]